MWEEMWENTSENPLFIYKIQYLMRWFGTSPATTVALGRAPDRHHSCFGLFGFRGISPWLASVALPLGAYFIG